MCKNPLHLFWAPSLFGQWKILVERNFSEQICDQRKILVKNKLVDWIIGKVTNCDPKIKRILSKESFGKENGLQWFQSKKCFAKKDVL